MFEKKKDSLLLQKQYQEELASGKTKTFYQGWLVEQTSMHWAEIQELISNYKKENGK